ncbi:MAG: DNA-binding protein, partial [Tannerella sp.]|nr:DNA-binding protein [Tannerella sp.]
MKSLLLFAVGLLVIAACDPKAGSLQSDISPAVLEQNFVNPPSSAKPHTWWHWMNGNISKEGITADLEAMAEAGLGGAQIFNVSEGIPHGGVQFNSPEWIEMVVHASKEAERLGLELCIHNCAGWANSGG